MKIEQLRYFLEAARQQHIGKAAGILYISPSAISHSISALERELGRELFLKQGKNVVLTSHGKLLMDKAQRFVEEIEGLKDEISSDQAQVVGHYRLAATHLLCSRYLVPAWNKVQRGHPGLSVEMYPLRSAQVVAGIASGEYDFGVCFNPQPHPNFGIEPLYQGRMLLAVRRGHPILKEPKHRLEAISLYPAALPKAFQGIDNCETHPVFKKFNIRPKPDFMFDSYEVAAQRLLSTDSWGLFPDFIVNLYPGLVSVAPKSGWDAQLRMAAVWPRRRLLPKVLKRLCAEMKILLSHDR